MQTFSDVSLIMLAERKNKENHAQDSKISFNYFISGMNSFVDRAVDKFESRLQIRNSSQAS